MGSRSTESESKRRLAKGEAKGSRLVAVELARKNEPQMHPSEQPTVDGIAGFGGF
jgi:hypothetical protein